ncbi:MAG: hypothetical protein MJ137_00705 [Clostridia bacterium]|nr:hypothetical protein [Clostridia bacterium]
MKPLEKDSVLFEGIVSVSALIKAADSGTARRKIIRVLIEESKFSKERHKVGFIRTASQRLGFVIEKITQSDVAELSSGKTHGGFFAEATSAVYPGLDDVIPEKLSFAVILDGTEDPYSLGHSARVLYSCGCDALIVPRLPDMADSVIVKASAGSFELLPVYLSDSAEAAALFKKAGIKIACAGIRDSVSLKDADLKYPLLLVCGGEKRGISSSVAGGSDGKNSLQQRGYGFSSLRNGSFDFCLRNHEQEQLTHIYNRSYYLNHEEIKTI